MIRSRIGSLVAFSVLAFSSSSNAAVDVVELNKILRDSNATWTAKETWASRLTLTEQRKLSGIHQPGIDPDVEFVVPQTALRRAGPAKFDWRSEGGVNWVTPILNQGSCGSCVAFAAIATMETQMRISSALPTLPVRLSPQDLHSCGGASCQTGWWPGSAAQHLKATGASDDACFPYTSGTTGKNAACSAACTDVSQRRVRIASFSQPTILFGDVEKVKRALLSGPVMSAMVTFEDFYAYSTGVYRHVTGKATGAHAVSIVGYDDTEQAWIVRNSWGEKWGEDGFGKIAYDDVSGVGRMTWKMEIPPPRGAVTLELPVSRSYASVVLPLRARSTIDETAQLKITFSDSAAQPRFHTSCTGSICERQLDVRDWPDGQYDVSVEAFDVNGGSLGIAQRESFFIANSKPRLALGFDTSQILGLNGTVNGRVKIGITAVSTSVPMTSLEFHIRGFGGWKQVRVAPVVPSNMTLAWETQDLPNGTYEIWITGRFKTSRFDESIESSHQTVRVLN